MRPIKQGTKADSIFMRAGRHPIVGKSRGQALVDYNEAIEQETSELIAINILRARDGVPTYYSEIPDALAVSDSSAVHHAPRISQQLRKSTTRNSTMADVSLQVADSFDVELLHTQDFYTRTRGTFRVP
jgi:hypothetical protein